MKKETTWCKLFSFSIPTYYNWKREKRPIVGLLEIYFSIKDLNDFLEKGLIEDLELFKKFLEFQRFQNPTNFNLILKQDNANSINKELEIENRELKNKLKNIQKIFKKLCKCDT